MSVAGLKHETDPVLLIHVLDQYAVPVSQSLPLALLHLQRGKVAMMMYSMTHA